MLTATHALLSTHYSTLCLLKYDSTISPLFIFMFIDIVYCIRKTKCLNEYLMDIFRTFSFFKSFHNCAYYLHIWFKQLKCLFMITVLKKENASRN